MPRRDILDHDEPYGGPRPAPRAQLLAQPTASWGARRGPNPGIAGGLGHDLVPCLSLDAVLTTSFRVADAPTLGATGLTGRYNWALSRATKAFASAGPAVLFLEGSPGSYAFAPGALVGMGLQQRLSDGYALRFDLTTTTPLLPGRYAWPPFQFWNAGLGLALEL